MQRSFELCTIGYEGKTLPDLLARLQGARVTLVIDVRALPLSRRRGFSKTPLSAALAAEGIGYAHVREAGNPFRANRTDAKKCLAMFRRHIASLPLVIEDLSNRATAHRSALLCLEADAGMCHRSVLAEAIRERSPNICIRDL